MVGDDDICYESADEVALNEALVSQLNTMMDQDPSEVPGFSAALLETVSRGEELCNYNGQHVEKRPDLVFRRQGRLPAGTRREYCGIFVECKIVDRQHSMKGYCGKGVERFVRGDYAWAMSLAMMIGYARDGYTLPRQLNAHLDTRRERYNIKHDARRRDSQTGPAPVYITLHERTWRYPSQEEVPGDIELAHLWLEAT